MRCQPWAMLALGLAALIPLSAANFAQAQVDIGEPPPAAPREAATADATDDGAIEELTRGPVHEAFAEQVSADPVPGIVVPKAPPEAIEEIPPDSKPADAKAIWIDGYWAWEDVDERFIWISGVWRVAPAGYRWTPGYWTEADGGWRWIGGFWASGDRAEVAYQPEPPDSLEEGPTSAAPSDAHIWVPGCWYYRDARYVWRPGYWTVGNDNWVWIPNYYRYTPGGYVLCGGYWDVPLATRGCLFAPVYFHRPIYTAPNWHYTPRVAIDLGPLHFHLFVRPNYCHYYFGDYYGSQFVDRGWYPWHTFHRHRHWHDPLFAFNVWHYKRRGIDFYDRYDRWHDHFQRHEEHRPRHTWDEQRDWAEKHRDRDGDRDDWKHASIAERFDDQVERRRERFVKLDDGQRKRFDAINDRVREFRRERAKIESTADARDVRRDGDGERGAGQTPRERPTLRLPEAVTGGGRTDRDDVRGAGRSDDVRDRVREFDRTDRPDRTPRGENRIDRLSTPDKPADTPETPAATPGDGRDDALPTLPRAERGDRIDRTPAGEPDRSPLLPQPGTVRDSERPFSVERRSESSRRDEDPRVVPTPDLRTPDGRDSSTPRSEVERPRLERPSREGINRVPRGDVAPRPDATPRVDRTPRVEGTLPRVETPVPRTFNREGFQRRESPRSGPSIRSGGERPSITPRAPRIEQPSISPRIQESRRIEMNRPSFSRTPSVPRSTSSGDRPSFSGRSGGERSTPSFSPRSSGGDRSPSFSRRSGGGGGSPSFRSSGGGNRGSSGFGGGGRGGGGRRGGGRDD